MVSWPLFSYCCETEAFARVPSEYLIEPVPLRRLCSILFSCPLFVNILPLLFDPIVDHAVGRAWCQALHRPPTA
jgi:hypothetical protein